MKPSDPFLFCEQCYLDGDWVDAGLARNRSTLAKRVFTRRFWQRAEKKVLEHAPLPCIPPS